MARKILAATALGIATAWFGTAHGQEMSYGCPLGGLGYEVQRAVGTGTLIDPQFVIVSPSASEMVDPTTLGLAYVLPMREPGVYVGPEGTFSLFRLELTPRGADAIECFGARRPLPAAQPASLPRTNPTPVIADAGFGPGSIADPGPRSVEAVEKRGISLGGKVRGGPGIDSVHVTSLPEGTPITIALDSGVWWNGYNWFVIERDGRQIGYQWGGILCAPDGGVKGAFPCP